PLPGRGSPGREGSISIITLKVISHYIGGNMRVFTAVLYKEEDVYVAECPEVGTVSQGKTVEEAVANLKEATELYLEEFPLEDGRRPIITTFEVAVGAGA
ncbi:type II toxin-antitoxin system HicB family antitoxin, partial [Methanoculleus sp.]